MTSRLSLRSLKGKATTSFVLAAMGLLAAVGFLAAPTWAQQDTVGADGYLYGTVTTSKGQSFTGLLRWADEEAFWGDLFNSRKEDTPYLDARDGGGSKREYEIFGRKISFDWGRSSEHRDFVTRFGDIRKIDVQRQDRATLTMQDGTEIELVGASNDVSSSINVYDPNFGNARIPWSRIDTITFAAAPAGTEPNGRRLQGTFETKAGTFQGFVQWDKQETLSFDRLDGDDGDIGMSIAMGNLLSVERDGDEAAIVSLHDGRTLTLDDSNDVDEDNRGLLIEDSRYGKVEVPWMTFLKATFVPPTADDSALSGPSYDTYTSRGALNGTATTKDGQLLRGRIVFDLDKEFDWETLTGRLDDVTYFIPFSRVASLTPTDGKTSVLLRNGNTLMLSDTDETTEDNAGVLVLNGSAETFVAWADLKTLTFD